jgi:hypothetical protein
MPPYQRPAFPIPIPHYATAEDTNGDLGDPGMSLRDYFAAAAMPALITSTLQVHGPSVEVLAARLELVACSAYTIADAMLAERDRPHDVATGTEATPH